MPNELAEQKSFQDKMMERIRGSIGELISNEELAKLVQQGVNKAFFEPRRTTDWGHAEEKEPWLVEELRSILQKSVKEMVDKALADHAETVVEQVHKVVQEGAGKAILAAINAAFSDHFNSLEVNIRQALAQQGR